MFSLFLCSGRKLQQILKRQIIAITITVDDFQVAGFFMQPDAGWRLRRLAVLFAHRVLPLFVLVMIN